MPAGSGRKEETREEATKSGGNGGVPVAGQMCRRREDKGKRRSAGPAWPTPWEMRLRRPLTGAADMTGMDARLSNVLKKNANARR